MSSPQTLRPATPHDDAFLRLLFAATHPALALLPEPIRSQLAGMQYRGRQLTYAAAYPAAHDLILCLPDDTPAGTPVGHMLFAATPTGLHLIDIAVLPEHQGHGLATFAIAHLQQLAADRTITLHLTPGNPAQRLYSRLGFQPSSATPASAEETSLPLFWKGAPAEPSLDTQGTIESDGNGLHPALSSVPLRPHRGSLQALWAASLTSRSKPNSLSAKTLSNKWGGGGYTLALALLASITGLANAQGILTVTPGRALSTAAGTGTVGYTGDNGPATSATLAAPSAVAYDANGNLYLADSLNHVVREISATGTITTLAGTGIAGFGGDGGAATAAFLDTPTGVAVDANGNVYIADSHNQRIRKVTSGTITTLAGTGVAGFSGDGGAATAAQLALPSAVAVDASGNVYIADRNNQRIRKITGTTISTIAGDGEELFSGDGGAATAAALDSPTGVAVDTAGNVYIADRNNQRVRIVNVGGTISTLAGSGGATFSGSFSGDGASATAATLARPSGVSVDSAGNVYIADTDNQRIRQVGGGAIATIVGTGAQGFGGDTVSAANLNAPRSVAPDASGNLAVGDRLNQRVRAATLPTLTFASQGVGVASTPQPVTLANTGTASITVSAATFTGGFGSATSPCGALPITLAPGASCVENLTFVPTTVGPAKGSVVFSGTGVVPQSVLFLGTSVKTAPGVSLLSSFASPFVGQPVTFTAGVSVPGTVPATGSVTFLDGTTPLGTSPIVSGAATLTTATLTSGSHSITAVYSGDGNYNSMGSSALGEVVLDFSFNLAVSSGSVQVVPGQAATFNFTAQPVNGPFPIPIVLSASGLPPGATAIFNPQSITLGSAPSNFTMTIQTPLASLHRDRPFHEGTIALGLLVLPFAGLLRRRGKHLRGLTLCGLLLLSFAALLGVSGCGTSIGFFAQTQKSYTVTVVGTATNAAGATLQHSTSVTLTVQ